VDLPAPHVRRVVRGQFYLGVVQYGDLCRVAHFRESGYDLGHFGGRGEGCWGRGEEEEEERRGCGGGGVGLDFLSSWEGGFAFCMYVDACGDLLVYTLLV